jgi:hypothetical protein
MNRRRFSFPLQTPVSRSPSRVARRTSSTTSAATTKRSWSTTSTPSTFDTAHGWLVAFGGQSFDNVTNDLWYYSVAENRWTEVGFAPTEPVPPGRVGGVSFVLETPDAFELYLHSGITNESGDGVLLNDLWKLTWPKD